MKKQGKWREHQCRQSGGRETICSALMDTCQIQEPSTALLTHEKGQVPSLWLLTWIWLTKENLGSQVWDSQSTNFWDMSAHIICLRWEKLSCPHRWTPQVPSLWPTLLFQPAAECELVVALTIPAKCHISLSSVSWLAYLIYVILPPGFVTFKRFPGISK